jgi:hypothetical membrane protein
VTVDQSTSPVDPGVYAGLAAVVASFGGIGTAMALAPEFSILTHALSDLGRRGALSAPFFNIGLMLAGLLGAWFVARAYPVYQDPVRRGALAVLAVSLLFMGLVGVFPLPMAPHGYVAITYFVSMTVGLALFGLGDLLADRPYRGLVVGIGALAHTCSWGYWILYPWFPEGIAIPELVGAFALAAWTVLVTREVRAAGMPTPEETVDRERL